MSHAAMTVTEALNARHSVRAFLDTPVPEATLREILQLAARAPSGGNVQPWQLIVLTGAPLTGLKTAMAQRLLQANADDKPEYLIYPPKLWEPHRTQRFVVGEARYTVLGIGRDDPVARQREFARNFAAFNAPVVVFCYLDRRMGPPQWADAGMYLQSLMLLLTERGLASCAQEAWSVFPKTVAAWTQPAQDWMLFCGVALGYADLDAPINTLRTPRLDLAQFARLEGFAPE